MAEKISINLLPDEFIAEELKKGKFYRVQAIGIFIILFMIFLSMLTVSLRVFQSSGIKSSEVILANAQSKVNSHSSKQTKLVYLKNRLEVISKELGISSKQVEMYGLVESLLPTSVNVITESIGTDGKILISAVVPDPVVLDSMFSDLLNVEKNEGKISKIVVEGIGRGRDNSFRVNFTIEGKD